MVVEVTMEEVEVGVMMMKEVVVEVMMEWVELVVEVMVEWVEVEMEVSWVLEEVGERRSSHCTWSDNQGEMFLPGPSRQPRPWETG